MYIKSGFPPRIVYVGSLEPQKTNVIPEGGVVEQNSQHQVGGNAERQVYKETFGKTEDELHLGKLRQKAEMRKRCAKTNSD